MHSFIPLFPTFIKKSLNANFASKIKHVYYRSMLTSVANFWHNLIYMPLICHQKWCCSYHFTSLKIEKPACWLVYFSKRAIWAFFLFTKNMRSRQCIRLGGPWRPLIRQRQFFSENLTPRILYIFSLKKWSTTMNVDLERFAKSAFQLSIEEEMGVPSPTLLHF